MRNGMVYFCGVVVWHNASVNIVLSSALTTHPARNHPFLMCAACIVILLTQVLALGGLLMMHAEADILFVCMADSTQLCR